MVLYFRKSTTRILLKQARVVVALLSYKTTYLNYLLIGP
ncbi:hypothetical protein SPFL3102_00720 [Sporomusaceae bacterium FL31]|nr:hypothetical protein SPFL3101_00562 [Sporomusaceae bacterium FL31]GCE32919.1 hypothetical protein SPFL3102_00720 [Sporomusaceae bacterium]